MRAGRAASSPYEQPASNPYEQRGEGRRLDRQWRLYEGATTNIVNLLTEHGHLDTVVATARSGEWFCAAGAVKELAARRDSESAYEVLAPYAETGWWYAVKAAADASTVGCLPRAQNKTPAAVKRRSGA